MNQDAPYIRWVNTYTIPDEGQSRDCLLRLRRLSAAPFVRPLQNHFHPEIEISVFLEGRGTYVVNRQEYPIVPGAVFLCGSMDQHCFSDIEGPDGLIFFTIHFEPRFVWSKGSNMFDARYLRVFDALGKEVEHRLPNGEIAEKILRICLSMEQEFMNRETDYDAMVKSQLLRMLVYLNRLLPKDALKEQSLPSSANLVQIEKAMTYIHDHLTEAMTLEEVAGAAHMSACYFSVIFKRLNGLSPWSYIASKRIEMAQNLLLESDMTVMEISNACGYNNAANFNRAFKQVTDMSPSTYRKLASEGRLKY